jgi:hypothetical protein
MMLMVSPIRERTMMEVRMESGIETAMMRVERQDDAADGGADEDGLVADRRDLEAGLVDDLLEAGDHGEDAIDDGECGRAAGFEDGDEHGTATVLADDIGLRGAAIGDVGDVVEVDGGTVDLLEREIGEAHECGRGAVELDVVFRAADLGGTTGFNDVLMAEGKEDVVGGETFCLEALGVEVDHDGALAAAVDVGQDGAVDGGELRTDEVEAEVVQLLLGEVSAGEAELKDGNSGGGEVDDLRGKDADGELLEDEFRGSGDLGVGAIERGTRLQIQLDDALAVDAGGFDVLDAIDESSGDFFEGGGDAAFDLNGREAGVLPGDRDDRNINVGKDVGGSAQDENRRRDEDEDREHDKRVGSIQREPDYAHR